MAEFIVIHTQPLDFVIGMLFQFFIHCFQWRKPEDRPFPLVWFSLFFVGLFLNILSIYVNASEYCKSTACVIFYVVNGFGIVLDAAFLWFWFLKCRLYLEKWCALNQDWFIDITEDDELKEPNFEGTKVRYMKDRSETPPVCLVQLPCFNINGTQSSSRKHLGSFEKHVEVRIL